MGAGFFVLGARLVRLCLRLGNRCVMCCGWGCRIETMRGMYPSVRRDAVCGRTGRKKNIGGVSGGYRHAAVAFACRWAGCPLA